MPLAKSAREASVQSRRRLRDLPPPEPAAGIDAYLAERQAALAFSPRRRANYDKYLAGPSRAAAVDYLPIKLDIENVSRCNFRCVMCVVADWKNGGRADDMTLASFRRLIDEQYGVLEIKLQGIGEPLMQRDDFFEMIRYARARRIWVRTTTNASLLHLRDNYRKLVDADPNEIQISIDGATKEVYEGIRRGGVYERVIENCRMINAYCRGHGIERTKMWTVVQRDNQHELEALVDLAARLGFTNQVFSLELSDWGVDAWHERNAAINVEENLNVNRLFALIERGERLGIRVRFWNVTEKYRAESPKTLCPWPFERAYVSSDGRVAPCCFIGNPDVHQLGPSLCEQVEFSDVWHGEDYRDFRQAHLDGAIPVVCRGCYYVEPPSFPQ